VCSLNTLPLPDAQEQAERADRRDVFVARAEARALLWSAGKLDLHDAVDCLQATAVVNGLVEALGQDAVQQIMARPFALLRERLPERVHERPDECVHERPAEAQSILGQQIFGPWLVSQRGVASAGELQRLVDEAMKRHAVRGAPQVTVDALYWAAREYGPSAFDRPENMERLARLSDRQLDELHARLKRGIANAS
jgi:hypothetical protein